MFIAAEILEIMMLVCFGYAWPMNLIKSIKSKTSKGKSLVFNIAIITGYIAGIVSKFLKMANIDMSTLAGGIFVFALIMYFVNLIMVSANLVYFFINKRYDRQRELEAQAQAKLEA